MPILLLGLQGCTTKTLIDYKTLRIPDKYLECKERERNFEPSEQAYSGDLKLLAIEQSAYILYVESEHDKCIKNSSDARRYQERIKNEK